MLLLTQSDNKDGCKRNFPDTAVFILLLLFRDLNKIFSHVRLKCLGDTDRTVLVEIIFKECNEHSRRCNYCIIEGMSEILVAIGSLNPDTESACLSVAEV